MKIKILYSILIFFSVICILGLSECGGKEGKTYQEIKDPTTSETSPSSSNGPFKNLKEAVNNNNFYYWLTDNDINKIAEFKNYKTKFCDGVYFYKSRNEDDATFDVFETSNIHGSGLFDNLLSNRAFDNTHPF
jgi:SPX domain protein involved in polyphosphate accumulation